MIYMVWHAAVAASAFMLNAVKMLLKGEVGGRALKSRGNYIVDHGKVMELCILNFCWTLHIVAPVIYQDFS